MDGIKMVAADSPSSSKIGGLRDIAEIIASVGEAAYRWNIADDTLVWSANACEILNISDFAMVGSGRAFARLMAVDNTQSRYDAVMNSQLHDSGTGVPYQVQYSINPSRMVTPFWIEDTGRWFAGPDGRPARAHGVIRPV